jgi:membrane peptidoglycan carboxypeptidase
MWLEQSLAKNEILELYLNVIEFGPGLYGIGPAAWHYFGRPASDLDPLEATFLVSILPAPVRRSSMWDAGALSAYYADYMKTLLREENKRGKIDEQELDAALAETLVFHKPGMPTPAPHEIAQKGVNKLDDPNADYDPVWAPDDKD